LGDYFSLGFFNISEIAQIYGLLFSQIICSVLILTKNGFGYILGDFFTNSSGHSASVHQLGEVSYCPIREKKEISI
jgi:hypothetical protein